MSKGLKVVLVGLPGAGKTTFGKQLARELNFPFFDSDGLIEQKHQMKIPMIFSLHGEGKFRDWESEVLEDILQEVL